MSLACDERDLPNRITCSYAKKVMRRKKKFDEYYQKAHSHRPLMEAERAAGGREWRNLAFFSDLKFSLPFFQPGVIPALPVRQSGPDFSFIH